MLYKNSKLFKVFIIILIIIVSFPILSYADEIDNSEDFDYLESSYVSTSASSEPDINSRAAVVIERSTGSILYGKNQDEQRKMASTTKIMTATIVLENVTNLSEIVTVSQKAASIGGSRLGLSTNCKITVKDLLYGLMLCSGNDDAVT